MTKVCVTGATGFVGSNLLSRLRNKEDTQVIALSRKLSDEFNGAKKDNVTWRRCDGFSLIDVEEATKDSDILIYLIHSMLPSNSLTQGGFPEFDLYLADNFARAAQKNGIKRIIYLSGLIPDTHDLSEHLSSRLEVEKTLSQYGNQVTTLRAGLIVGKNGSSFKILERLSRRLPISICPSWTLSKTQPIDIEDVIECLVHTLENPDNLKPYYDIGGPDILTYREMLLKTAEVLNKKRYILNVPFFSPALSKLWVSKVTSTAPNLVYPLVESLKHDMVVDPKKQLLLPQHSFKSFMSSLQDGIQSKQKKRNWVRSVLDYNSRISFKWLKTVTSIQRIPNPGQLSAQETSALYFSWTPHFLRPFVRVVREKEIIYFLFLGKIKILELQRSSDRSNDTRSVYYISGGLLAHDETINGRLEFRNCKSSECILIALINFNPSLPWFIYKFTQALIHLFVMNRFRSFFLKRGKIHPS